VTARIQICSVYDRLCGLVVRVLGYRCRGPSSISGATRLSDSLVSAIEELLGRKSSGSGLENREYGSRDPSHWPCGTLYPQKLALTWPTSGGRSVGRVRSRTQAKEFSFYCSFYMSVGLFIRQRQEQSAYPIFQKLLVLYHADKEALGYSTGSPYVKTCLAF
jgi:hypothetical protein